MFIYDKNVTWSIKEMIFACTISAYTHYFAFPITLSAYVSHAAPARHSTTVENSPSPSRLSTSYGPTRVSVSKESAGTQGGSASCFVQVLSKSVWPAPWRYLGSSFLRTDDMAQLGRFTRAWPLQDSPMHRDAKLLSKGQNLCHLTAKAPGLPRSARQASPQECW